MQTTLSAPSAAAGKSKQRIAAAFGPSAKHVYLPDADWPAAFAFRPAQRASPLSRSLRVTKRACTLYAKLVCDTLYACCLGNTTARRHETFQLLFGVHCVQVRRIRNASRLTVNGQREFVPRRCASHSKKKTKIKNENQNW